MLPRPAPLGRQRDFWFWTVLVVMVDTGGSPQHTPCTPCHKRAPACAPMSTHPRVTPRCGRDRQLGLPYWTFNVPQAATAVGCPLPMPCGIANRNMGSLPPPPPARPSGPKIVPLGRGLEPTSSPTWGLGEGRGYGRTAHANSAPPSKPPPQNPHRCPWRLTRRCFAPCKC